MWDKPDPMLAKILASAFGRLHANLDAALPRTAPQLRELLHGAPTQPDHAFGPRSFPHLLLPYWISPTEERRNDLGFQTDVMYSSIIGYYSIRLCDNIADNDCAPELRKLAPCGLYFDSEAIRVYTRHFDAAHDFWPLFEGFSAQQSDASAADGLLKDIDAATFASLSAQKFTGTKIPVSACLLRYARPRIELEAWGQFVDRLGAFAQFNNDFFDWNHDSKHGIVTYLSSHARRRAPDESVTTWMMREGFDWGVAELKSRFNQVNLYAETMGNAEIRAWLAARERVLGADIDTLHSGFELMKTFGRIVSGQPI